VNFHWNPGRGTAGWADPTWPNRAGYSIPCAVMLDSGWRELGSRISLMALERAVAAVGQSCSLRSAVLCCVFSLSASLLLLFPSFAIPLNCPYPDPPVSDCFLSVLLRTPAGGGAAEWSRGTFVAGRS